MNIIKDDMVKESKMWKKPMVFFFVLVAAFPSVLIWNDIEATSIIVVELLYLLIGCFFLYGYLYTCKYKVLVTSEKIVLKTLFKKVEVLLKDIKSYNCKRYKKSEFYQFFILYKEGGVMINTRYKDDFKKLLEDQKQENLNNWDVAQQRQPQNYTNICGHHTKAKHYNEAQSRVIMPKDFYLNIDILAFIFWFLCLNIKYNAPQNYTTDNLLHK